MTALRCSFRRCLIGAFLIAASGATLAQGAPPQTAGEVAKIDKATARLTLKHAEIKHLGMPAMTMAWRVSEPKWLDTLAVGDRVRFQAERIDGQFTVTAIAKAP